MKTEVNKEFKSYVIELTSMEEVRELAGILGKTVRTPKYIRELYNDLANTCAAPMSGLYVDKITRSSTYNEE